MIHTEIRLIVFFAAKMEMLYTTKTKPGVGHELCIAELRLKLKKMGKANQSFS